MLTQYKVYFNIAIWFGSAILLWAVIYKTYHFIVAPREKLEKIESVTESNVIKTDYINRVNETDAYKTEKEIDEIDITDYDLNVTSWMW